MSAPGLVFAAYGLIFGSFASMLSYRLPRGLPVLLDRSRCASCSTALRPLDLVPVLSWLRAGGKCRHCGETVSRRYPAIEAAMSALFLLSWWSNRSDLVAAFIVAMIAFGLLVVVVSDLETGLIPDSMVIFLLLVGGALGLRQDWSGEQWLFQIAASVGMSLLFLALREGMKLVKGRAGCGLGDVKFAAAAGLLVGPAGFGIYIAAVGVIGIAFGLVWRKGGRGPEFPLGPALCCALLVQIVAAGM